MTSQEGNKELAALVQLIDEPDEHIYGQIRDRILSYGVTAIPYLEEAWSNNLQPVAQHRIEVLLNKLQFKNIFDELSDWHALGGSNLLMGYLLVTQYQYPNLDEEVIRKEINRIKKEIWLELNDDLTALEKVKVMNKVLFTINNFRGDKKNFYSPANSYINNVLESRKGNPLALAMIYIILSDMLEVPIYGVNLPDHFILAYIDKNTVEDDIQKAQVLFYINPFSGGAVFTNYEIEAYLKKIKLKPHSSYYQPCTNIDMIIRLLHNLMHSYDAIGNKVKVAELELLLKIFEK